MAVDRLDHISHIDDLNLVDDAPLSDSLEAEQQLHFLINALHLDHCCVFSYGECCGYVFFLLFTLMKA